MNEERQQIVAQLLPVKLPIGSIVVSGDRGRREIFTSGLVVSRSVHGFVEIALPNGKTVLESDSNWHLMTDCLLRGETAEVLR